MGKALRLSLLLISCALGLAACGVRGPLDSPPEAKADKTATAQSGQGKPEGGARKPHKDFVLDGLIR